VVFNKLNNWCRGMNPYIIELMLKEKREEMLREAERQRCLALYEADRPRIASRIAVAAGDILIRLGERLKNRYSLKVELPTAS